MAHRDYRHTLIGTPHLLALWDRVTRLSQEFPGYVLVKRTPFLISEGGKIRKYDTKQFVLLPAEELRGMDSLSTELSLIEYMLHCGFLKRKQIARLETRSRLVLKRVNELSLMATTQEHDALQRAGVPVN
jgi:hypothetical protein